MRVRVDRDADAVTLILSDAAIEDSAEIADGIVVDYDAQRRIVGIEVLDASRRTGDPQALAEMRFELPGRRDGWPSRLRDKGREPPDG